MATLTTVCVCMLAVVGLAGARGAEASPLIEPSAVQPFRSLLTAAIHSPDGSPSPAVAADLLALARARAAQLVRLALVSPDDALAIADADRALVARAADVLVAIGAAPFVEWHFHGRVALTRRCYKTSLVVDAGCREFALLYSPPTQRAEAAGANPAQTTAAMSVALAAAADVGALGAAVDARAPYEARYADAASHMLASTAARRRTRQLREAVAMHGVAFAPASPEVSASPPSRYGVFVARATPVAAVRADELAALARIAAAAGAPPSSIARDAAVAASSPFAIHFSASLLVFPSEGARDAALASLGVTPSSQLAAAMRQARAGDDNDSRLADALATASVLGAWSPSRRQPRAAMCSELVTERTGKGQKWLYVRVRGSDQQSPNVVDRHGAVMDDAHFQAAAVANAAFFREGSWGQLDIDTTGVVVAPGIITISRFIQRFLGDVVQEWKSDARASLAALGINYCDYVNVVYVASYDSAKGYLGLAELGGRGMFLNGDVSVGTASHEMGHTYGLAHAAIASPVNAITGPFASGSSNQEFLEYGDYLDIMGNLDKNSYWYLDSPTSALDTHAHLLHFQAMSKAMILGWMKPLTPASDSPSSPLVAEHVYGTDSTYELFPADHAHVLDYNVPIAVRINRRVHDPLPGGITGNPVAPQRAMEFWLEHRSLASTAIDANIGSGVDVRIGDSMPDGWETPSLVDMSPSAPRDTDTRLRAGQTYIDCPADVLIRAVRAVQCAVDTSIMCWTVQVRQGLGDAAADPSCTGNRKTPRLMGPSGVRATVTGDWATGHSMLVSWNAAPAATLSAGGGLARYIVTHTFMGANSVLFDKTTPVQAGTSVSLPTNRLYGGSTPCPASKNHASACKDGEWLYKLTVRARLNDNTESLVAPAVSFRFTTGSFAAPDAAAGAAPTPPPTPTPTVAAPTPPPTPTPTVAKWERYAMVTQVPVLSSHFRDGYSSRWVPDTIEPCAMYAGVALVVRVTMGTYVDYFKPTGTLCEMFASVGQWYYHSYVGENGPWKAVNGNHSALLGGFFPYQAQDGRVWGPFVGAPDGPTGYHAEGGGCCHAAPGDAVQFWRTFTIDVIRM